MKKVFGFTLTPALVPAGAVVGVGDSTKRGQPVLFAQEDEVVTVHRRRPSDQTAPQDREQAEAPRRRQDDGGLPPAGGGGGGGGLGSGGGGPFSGGGLPGGGRIPGGCGGLIIVIILVVIALLGGPNLLNLGSPSNQNNGNNQPAQQQPVTEPTATEVVDTPTEAAADQPANPPATQPAEQPAQSNGNQSPAASGSTPGQRWTVLLYQDADDKVLAKDIYIDLNEAERVGSTDRVNIVAQIDRYHQVSQGTDNWAGAKRFLVTKDNDLDHIHSKQLADLGNINMSDSKTLIDFVTWGIKSYPADKYVLILSDHGMGWPGGWSDASSENKGAPDPNIPLENAIGNILYLKDLDKALGTIRSQAGLDKFEVIGLDACLMSQLEVFNALQPHAHYAVASEETEPSLGFAYTSFLSQLTANPDIDGATLSKAIVKSYIDDDQRIVDDRARAEFASRGSTLGGIFGILNGAAAAGPSAQEVAKELDQDITLTAFDLTQTPALNQAVNTFATALQGIDQKSVAQARNYAQSYTSIFGDQVPPSYIDLNHFTQLLQQMGATGPLGDAITQVQAAIKQGVIAEKHGPNKPGSAGVAIYFPVSQLYRSAEAGPSSYTAIANRFATESLWDDFLAFHYTGHKFDTNTKRAAVPARGTAVRGPGASQITVAPITLSGKVAAPGKPVTMQTKITGENIGYVYEFAGFYDKSANSIFVADTDYLESSDTRQVDGVYYPVWPSSGSFTLKFDWEPLMFAISDGTTTKTALFQPQTYGAQREEATYTVDGTYKFADSGEQRAARLYFRNGVLRQVFGFTNENETGAPREISPQKGDTFTIQEQWLDLDQNGRVTKNATQQGGVLTFGDQPFTWKEQNAAHGDYVIGFIVKDLDGNATEVYTAVTVQ